MFFNTGVHIERLWPLLLILLFIFVYMFIVKHVKHFLAFNVYNNWKSNFLSDKILLGLSNWLLLFACTLFLLNSMGISKVKEQEIIAGDTSYMLFAIDISPSMSAEDSNNISRWQTIKDSMNTFLINVNNTKIGLIVFANSMSMIVPFTEDYLYIKQVMEEIELGSLGNDTALADAFLFADNIYQSIPSNRKSVVIITDGVQNSGSTKFADLERYMSQSYRNMIILQLGSEKRSKFNYVDTNSEQIISGFLNPMDNAILEEFAVNSNIAYLLLQDSLTFDLFFTSLQKLTSKESHVKKIQEYESLTNMFAILAGMFFILFLVIRHIILRALW